MSDEEKAAWQALPHIGKAVWGILGGVVSILVVTIRVSFVIGKLASAAEADHTKLLAHEKWLEMHGDRITGIEAHEGQQDAWIFENSKAVQQLKGKL